MWLLFNELMKNRALMIILTFDHEIQLNKRELTCRMFVPHGETGVFTNVGLPEN
jgi:hypothetical protein